MTLKEAQFHILEQLKPVYDPGEAAGIASWVVEYLSGLKKSDRISNNQKQLDENAGAQLESIIDRLLQHEPIQYVLNEAWFSGLKLYVDKNVLIPRPETEELVEWIISDCKFPINKLSILDVGTGSGCIALALKKRLGKADVWTCDISAGALAVARRNALQLGIDIHFVELNFLNKAERNQLPDFHIIVSNPPYVPEKDKSTMNPNVLNYEPATALFVPDDDALIFYSAIAHFGKTHLQDGGGIYTEIHESLGTATVNTFHAAGYKSELVKDMQGKERMVKAF
jgi:release factor glutamine methyltransferase